MAEGLDSALEFRVTVEVGWPSLGVDLLAQVGLEGVNDKAHLKTIVGGEDSVGVDTSEFERPVADEDNLLVQVSDLDVGELLLEFVESGAGEVGGHEEVAVGDEEVGGGFLDEDLEHLLGEVFGESVEVAAVVNQIGEEGLEC